MGTTKNYFKVAIGGTVLLLTILSFHHDLVGQYFPHGIYNFDVWGTEYLFTQAEYNRIVNLNANYLSDMSPRAQGGMVDSCNNSSGALRIQLGSDPTYDYLHPDLGPFYPRDGDDRNTLLWAYISLNQNISRINYDSIRIFIEHVYTTYAVNFSGIDGIRVAHQGAMRQPDHWPFIQYAGDWIQHYFGDAVKSVVIDNSAYWTAAALEDFFSNTTGVGDSLDVFQHEYYPFHDPNPGGPDYIGDTFQNLIDGYVASCELTRSALNASGNTHTTLEMHIQTFAARYGATYFRRPTQAEIWLQAFLALSRNFKGIHTYVYRSYTWPSPSVDYETGLINAARQPINVPSYNPPYNNVAGLYAHLDSLGPQLLPLEVWDAYTWDGATRHKYLKRIDGDTLEQNSRTIEVCLFYPQDTNGHYDHFMLINRRCNRDSAGCWVNAYPQYINVTLADSMATGNYQIRDLYSNELYVTSDKIFRQIKILAGRGRVFELRKIFDTNETWANTVNVSSNITVPTGRILTIQPNSIVKFYTNTELKAQGKLTANGTTTQHIKFTSAATTPARGNWKWIKFDNYWSSSSLNYCDIEYAQTGIWVYGANANPTIQHCDIKECSQYGVRLENNTSATTFKYNSLHHNSVYGVFLMTASPLMFNISATNNDNSGLFCSNSSPKLGSIETMEADQTKFSNNTQHGIWCTGSPGSSPIIYRNTKTYPNGGYVRLTGNGGNGIRANSGSQPHLGESSSSPGYNSIYNNGSFEIWNGNSSYSITAKYNWWGSESGPPPDSCNNSLLLARPYLNYDPGNPAKGGFQPPLASDDTSHISQLQRGEIYFAAGELEQALSIFEQIISDNPKSEDAKYALSDIVLCYQELDWQDQIVPYLDIVAEQYPKQDIGYWAMVHSVPWLETEAKYDEAIKRCEMLQQEYQSNKDVSSYLPFQMAMIYKYGLNDNKLAVQYFTQFLNASPDHDLAVVAKLELEDCKAIMELPKQQASDPVVASVNTPEKYALSQNFPNPFNPATEIHYQLPEDSRVILTVYNLLGQKIRTLVDKTHLAGAYSVRWDSKDDRGMAVSSGVYLYIINANQFHEVKKMLLLRYALNCL